MGNWFTNLFKVNTNISAFPTGPVKPTFFTWGNQTIYFDLDCEDDYRKAYLACPPLKAILTRRAQMFVNGEVQILNKNNDNTKRGAIAKQLKEKLKKPNCLQSWKQFFAQLHTYTDLFGYCVICRIRPAGMPNEISSLWCLPPWLLDIDYTGKWLKQTERKQIIGQIYLNWNGKKEALDMDNTLMIFDNSFGTQDDTDLLIPDSRVRSNELPISNIVASYKARNSLITKKGAIGILSNVGKDQMGAIPLNPTDKDNIQQDFRRYGLQGEEWQVIITDANLQWQSMSFPTKDLMLFEEIEDDIQRLCDGMGLYYDLISKTKASTFNNIEEAKKSQYQDHIIPDAEARIEQLSSFIIPESENAYLWISYKHLEIFQQSIKEKAEGLSAQADALKKLYDLGLITRNMALKELEMDEVTGIEEFDKYSFEQTPVVEMKAIPGNKSQANEATI